MHTIELIKVKTVAGQLLFAILRRATRADYHTQTFQHPLQKEFLLNSQKNMVTRCHTKDINKSFLKT